LTQKIENLPFPSFAIVYKFWISREASLLTISNTYTGTKPSLLRGRAEEYSEGGPKFESPEWLFSSGYFFYK